MMTVRGLNFCNHAREASDVEIDEVGKYVIFHDRNQAEVRVYLPYEKLTKYF